MIVARSCHDAITTLLKDLQKEFALKDLGDVHYFRGIEVKKARDGLLLTQEKYTSDILERVGMKKCKAIIHPCRQVRNYLLMKGHLSRQKIPQGIEVLLMPCST
jgi:hypothetical protein